MTRAVSKAVGAETVAQLIEALARLQSRRTAPAGESLLLYRLEFELEQSDPLIWLAAQPHREKVYWQDRDRELCTAAVGAADSLQATKHDELPDMMRRASSVLVHAPSGTRYFGGLRFDSGRAESECDPLWESFPAARLVLPRFEVISDRGRHYLTCNVFERELGQAALAEIIESARQLRFEPAIYQPEALSIAERGDSPEKVQWQRQINRALELFAKGKSEKLVLARKTSLLARTLPDPWLLLAKLREQSDQCFIYGYAPGRGAAFIGASPERLYRRDHRELQTEAIAGTRPRGYNAQTDNVLAAALADSAKERREHEIVVEGILDGLETICENYSLVESRASLRLQALQHLVSRIRGQLRHGVDDLQIITALHPTPAVGGFPAREAVALLSEFEAFDRGWYAGPFGWLAKDRAEFAVAIRSALVCERRIDLFAGAGIVPGSEADSEWDEIEHKLRAFLGLFDLEAR
ncbi:MAG: isochorismate synthase [Candidatus Zixiibacteriota bacterium]